MYVHVLCAVQSTDDLLTHAHWDVAPFARRTCTCTQVLFFMGCMVLNCACWLGVRLLEGPRSQIELPAKSVVVTADADARAAGLL